MDQGGHRESALEAADAARAEAEAAAEAALGDQANAATLPDSPADHGIEVEPHGPVQSLPVLVDPMSSACPFLRLERDGVLRPAMSAVDRDHRCAALSAPVALSDAQQSLVCLVDSHLDCPRYLHGTGTLRPVAGRARPSVPRPTLAAAAILAASLVVTLAYTASSGGLSVPLGTAGGSSSAAIVASASAPTSPGAGTRATLAASASPSAPESASPVASETPSAAPSTSPSPLASPPLRPSPSPSGSPSGDRYALLQPCPGRPSCYVYTVRAGDNLTSIGLWFGVPFDTILRLNPWIRDPTTIHKGERIVLPPPTR